MASTSKMATSLDNSKLQSAQELRKRIREYKPGKTLEYNDITDYPPSLYVGLFGDPGCGKTSLINSIMYAVHEKWEMSRWLPVGDCMEGAHTLQRVPFKVAESITIVDNKGVPNASKQWVLSEMKNQIDGKRGYTAVIDWDHGIPPKRYEKGDCLHVVVFVYRAISNVESTVVKDLTTLSRDMAYLQGPYPLAVITHADQADEKKIERLMASLKSYGITEVFCVANIHRTKPELEPEYQKILLEFLDRCMTDGDRNLMLRKMRKEEAERKQKCKVM